MFRKRFAQAGVKLEIPDLEQGSFRDLTLSGQLRVIERTLEGEPAHLIGSSMEVILRRSTRHVMRRRSALC